MEPSIRSMSSPGNHAGQGQLPSVVPAAQTSTRQKRQSSATTTTTNGAPTKSDHYNSSEDDAKPGRHPDANDDQARKRRKLDGISSCETCKQRKVKCDRSQPSCGWCSRNSQECIYRQKKKPGLRAGIGRELEERLDSVEKILARHSLLLEQQPQQSAAVVASSALQFSSPSESHKSSLAGGGAGAGAGSPLQPVAQQQQQQQFFVPAGAAFRERNREMAHLSASHPFDEDLPPNEILWTMVETFFKYVYPSCPILHHQTLLDNIFNRRPEDVPESDVILLHAIVAAALRFCTDPRVDDSWKKTFASKAKNKVILYALENPTVEALRAIVIMVFDVVGSTNGPSGWALLAMTTRTTLHLGMTQDIGPAREAAAAPPAVSTMGIRSVPESQDWIEEESRRRLFWMIYLLDVITTLGTSLDLNLAGSEIERQLPCNDDLWNRNARVQTRWFHTTERTPPNPPPSTSIADTLSSFSYQIEVIGILAQIHRFLRSTVDIKIRKEVDDWKEKFRTLDKELTTWKRGLPAAYSNITRALHRHSPMDPAWILLHVYHNISVIRLHSAAAYPSTHSTIFTPSYAAEQRCLSAVENITALTRRILQHDDSGDPTQQLLLPKLGPTFCFTIWIAARLLIVHASTSGSASPDVSLFLGCLRRAGVYWQTARRYAEILQRVLDELEARCVGDDAGACLMILRDMRMTAHTVDVMISRQPDRRATKGTGDGDGGVGGAGSMECVGMAPGASGAGGVGGVGGVGCVGSVGSVGCVGMAPGTGGAGMVPINWAGVAVNGAVMSGAGTNGAVMSGAGTSGAGTNGAGTNGDYGDLTDIFGWFNFPRLPGEVVVGSNGVVGGWVDPAPGSAEGGDWFNGGCI